MARVAAAAPIRNPRRMDAGSPFQSDRDGDFEIYLSNRYGGQLLQLTHNDIWDRLPAWAPNGDWIVYSSDIRRDESLDLYRMRPVGTDRQPLFSNGWRNSHARYSADGNYVVFTSGPGVRDASTWEIRLFDRRNGASRLLTENAIRDASPSFSPDSRRILYVTTIAGERALASMNLQGGEREALYTGPGRVWSAELQSRWSVPGGDGDPERQRSTVFDDRGWRKRPANHDRRRRLRILDSQARRCLTAAFDPPWLTLPPK